MNNTSNSKLLVFLATAFLLFGCSEPDVLTGTGAATGTETGTETGTVTASAHIGSSSGSTFIEGTLQIKINTIEASGSTVISAFIVDNAFNLSALSHTVTFSSDCAVQLLASFSATSVITTTGIATTTYIDQGCQLDDSLRASVIVDGVTVSASGTVTINSAPTQTTIVRIGTGSGATFSNGAISIAPGAISALGTAAISVNLVDGNGVLLTTNQTVTFGSTCVTGLLANLSASSVPTSNGTASTTYTASGCSNTDDITASVTADGAIITAAGTLTIAQPDAGSIQFTSAASSLIALKGTGSTTGLPENSNIIFTVLDNIGTPISGVDVTFTLGSNVGGATLASLTATSNVNGEVVATVQSGTVATSVRVTAVLVINPALVTTSSAIVIATGPPDQDSMTLSAVTLNPRAFNLYGNTVDITIQLADRFNNIIQDGTSILFRTELGAIEPSCSTVNGQCTIKWTSALPKTNPAVTNNAGRTTIWATVEGEESFDDTNSNGVFDDNDIGFFDKEEAFIDEDEDGVYNALPANDEFFIDFDNSGAHDAGNGLYDGAGCTHTSLCNPAANSITVRDSLVLVMAEDNPDVYGVSTNLGAECISQAECNTNITPNNYPSVFNLGAGGVASATFTIAGLVNGEVLPIGTIVSFSTTNGKITAGGSHTVSNSIGAANPAGGANTSADTSFTVFLAPDTTPSSDGSLKIEVAIGQSGATFPLPPIALTDFAPLRIGSGIGTAFNEGVLTVDNGNPSANTTINLSATLVDITSALSTSDTSVIFTSTCSIADPPTASFGPAYVSTTTGDISTTYTPITGCAGLDKITATVNAPDPAPVAFTTIFVNP